MKTPALVVAATVILATAARAQTPAPGKLVEHVTCPSDPTQTYTLYLPSAYVPARTWPLLLVFDPGGRGARAAEIFRPAAERYGWIVAASENSRNGPWEPTRRAVLAMWPALLQGYAVDRERIYAAGHSGGASVAWTLARETGQIAGVIASGEPNPGPDTSKPIGFAWFGTAGHTDFNFFEVKSLDARVARAGKPHRVEFFDGGHQWMPEELTFRALAWHDMVAMKNGRRAADPAFAAAALADDMTRARALEERGLFTEARRSYATIVETYGGIVEVRDEETRRKALDADDRFKRARKDEDKADGREREYVERFTNMLSRLAGTEPPLVAELRGMLDLASLDKAARGDSYDAASARRSLEMIFVQTGMYVPRDFEEKRDFARAAMALEIATGIHPERTALWVELAADRALSGSKGSAIEALARAIDHGYTDKAALSRDERLASLRGVPAFEKLLQRLP
jgi:dienelactone hydrolase